MRKIAITTTFFILIVCMACCKNKVNTTTVPDVSLERYMGLWYEVARIDHSFEEGLVGCTAHYTLQPDGKVEVINAGFEGTLQGKHKESKGVAKMPDPNQPGKLKVSFFPGIYGAYNIIALDTQNYNYALVGGNSKDYLWILSRTPVMDYDTQLQLIEIARSRGYDVSKIIFPEKPNL